jgi:hypothetical protein
MASGFSKGGKEDNFQLISKQDPSAGNEQPGDAVAYPPVTKLLGQMARRRSSISLDRKEMPDGPLRDLKDAEVTSHVSKYQKKIP